MDQDRKRLFQEIREELEALRVEIDAIGKRESEIARRLDPIEKTAMELRDDRISFAIRDAYMSMIDAGRGFTQVHMDLIISPTVFHPPEEHEEQQAEAA